MHMLFFYFVYVFHAVAAVMQLRQFIRIRAFDQRITLRFPHQLSGQIHIKRHDQNKNKNDDSQAGHSTNRRNPNAKVTIAAVYDQIVGHTAADYKHPCQKKPVFDLAGLFQIDQHHKEEIPQADHNQNLHVF